MNCRWFILRNPFHVIYLPPFSNLLLAMETRMALSYVLLLITSCCIVSLNARLSSSGKSMVMVEEDANIAEEAITAYPPRQLQYSTTDESRYMVWDFSEKTNPLKFPGVRADEMFGSAVSVWDEYMVVGASGDRSREFASGAVYMYSKQAYSDGSYYWEFLEVLEPWDGAEGDNFGVAVDLHLYTMVVGANMHDEHGQDAGAAYIYECYNNAAHHHDEHHKEEQDEMQRMWYLAAKLMPDEGMPQDYFGSTVATQGNSTVVGAYGSDVMGTFAGTVYVWRKTWNLDDPHHAWEWVYDQIIVASDGERYDFFGTSLAIYDNKLAIGAPGVDEDEMYKVGAVYVYLHTYDDSVDAGFSYQLLDKLTPGENGITYENFGQSVAMWDYNLVVGAPNSDANGSHAAGAFYSYGFDRYQKPYLLERVEPAHPSPEAHCGYSIDVYEDLAAMGCPNASGYGSVYIYTEVSPLNTPSTKNIHWLFEARKRITGVWSKGDMFGHTVSVYGDTVAAGAYKAMSGMGATYMYMGRKKIYQDLFEINETDTGGVIIDDEEGGIVDEIEELLLHFEEQHPAESRLIVLVMFLLVLLAVTVYHRRGEMALSASSGNYRKTQSYELATMDSTHNSGNYNLNQSQSNSDSSTSHNSAIPPASSRHGGATYTPITTSATKGSSQRVRDLAAAGLMAKPTHPPASPVFSPLATPSSFAPNRSAAATTTPPESVQ